MYNIYRDCPRGVPMGGQNVQKLTHVPLAIAILLVHSISTHYHSAFEVLTLPRSIYKLIIDLT